MTCSKSHRKLVTRVGAETWVSDFFSGKEPFLDHKILRASGAFGKGFAESLSMDSG